MQPREIKFGKRFLEELARLPKQIQEKTLIQIDIFQKDPLYPSLRLHKLSGRLKGLWSLSVTSSHRIIFETLPDGSAFMVSVGTHSIYEK